MGQVRFASTQTQGRHRQAGMIGGIARVEINFTATTIVESADGRGPIFGPEIPITRRQATQTIWRRRSSDPQPEDYHRFEFAISLAEAKQAGLGPGSKVLIAELPLAQRRVHILNLQGYSEAIAEVVFEDLLDLPAPLDTVEGRAAATADAARAAVHGLRKDPFISERVLTASMSSAEIDRFRSYEDDHPDVVRRRRDETFAVAALRDVEQLRQRIMADRDLVAAFMMSGEGRLHTRHNKDQLITPITEEVANTAPIHFDLAVRQAMCGAGLKADGWTGQPVALYARILFEAHMLNALRRRDGDLVEYLPMPFGDRPSQDEGDYGNVLDEM